MMLSIISPISHGWDTASLSSLSYVLSPSSVAVDAAAVVDAAEISSLYIFYVCKNQQQLYMKKTE